MDRPEEPSAKRLKVDSSGGSEDPKTAVMNELSVSVRVKLENMFNSGKISRDELETCCIDSLKDFSEQEGNEIVDKFLEADLSTLRSKTAFFIGILKRFRTKKGGGDSRGPPPSQPYGFQGHGAAGHAAALGHAAAMGHASAVGLMGLGPPGMYPPPPMMGGDKDTQDREHALNLIAPAARYKMEMLFMSGRLAREELAPCCIDSLQDFDEYAACEIIDKFASADLTTIQSKTAFFIGILKRFRNNPKYQQAKPQQLRPPVGGPPGHQAMGHGAPAGKEVLKLEQCLSATKPSVHAKLTDMFNSGKVQKHEIEACCIDSLNDFSEDTACKIVDKFMEADMGTIRNKTAFFIGVLKRHRALGGAGGGGPAGGAGSSNAGSSASSDSRQINDLQETVRQQQQQINMMNQMLWAGAATGNAVPPGLPW